MLFSIGLSNWYGIGAKLYPNDTEQELHDEYITFVKYIKKHIIKRISEFSDDDNIRRRVLENLEINERYGKQYWEMYIQISLADVETIPVDKRRDCVFRFSKIYRGVHCERIIDLKEYETWDRLTRFRAVVEKAVDSVMQIKAKKKGDFDAERLIADIREAQANFSKDFDAEKLLAEFKEARANFSKDFIVEKSRAEFRDAQAKLSGDFSMEKLVAEIRKAQAEFLSEQ
jgi:hypothetical protein